jgi:hypothetical protein
MSRFNSIEIANAIKEAFHSKKPVTIPSIPMIVFIDVLKELKNSK